MKKRIFFATIVLLSVVFFINSSAVAATQQDFLNYANAAVGKYYPNGWCLKFVSDFFAGGYGNISGMGFPGAYGLTSAYYCYYNHVTRHDGDWNIPIGADVFFDGYGYVTGNDGVDYWTQVGHVGIYIGDGYMIEASGGSVNRSKVNEMKTYYRSGGVGVQYLGWAWHPNVSIDSEIRGSEMSQGYDRAIPDGDYLIVASGRSNKATFMYLDIVGTDRPAPNDRNVQLVGAASEMPSVADIWTVTYNSSDKFYTIKQYGTNMCLDVYCADTLQGTNVQVYQHNNGSAQKWAISRNGRDGYRLEAKCSGFSLDIAGGAVDTSGTNVQQWSDNDSAAQSWQFIPYQPSQPIAVGRYILLYETDRSYELDVSGDTGDIPNNTNVQLWSDTAPSEFNSFEFSKLNNGYYKVRHVASGKCLDVSDGLANYKANVAVHDDNGSAAQQWAVISNGSGYSLVSKVNGYALDLPDGTTGDGKNVEVYPVLQNPNQRWNFVPAEYKVAYYAPEGSGVPAEQTKYYKTDLVLSSIVPTRAGYKFICWEDILSLDDNNNTDKYYPGQTYTRNEGLALYPVWQSISCTVTYDANGGTGAPAPQTFNIVPATLSSQEPVRPHYSFMGWSISRSSTEAEYQPGGFYYAEIDITLYAVWQRILDNLLVLSKSLTEIETEAFHDTSADAVVIPPTITSIGAGAFDDVVVYGYEGTEAETYADRNGLLFIPITNGWVHANEVPNGAHVTDHKWTYTLSTAETTTSTESSLPGWTQTGWDWKQSGTGSWKYASYPSGFDTGSSLYSKYNKAALSGSEEGNSKRAVGSSSLSTYIYWHWTFVDSLNSDSDDTNVLVEDAKRYNVQTGNVYRDYVYFDAFESTTDYGTVGPGKSGMIDVAPMRYAWRGVLGDVSHWWWRFEVYEEPYTDYVKEYTYVRNSEDLMESENEVVPGEGISNIQHWVKYEF